MTYLFIEYLHVPGAIIILGTGAGIALLMLIAHIRASADVIACTMPWSSFADTLFTLAALIAEPITGALLMKMSSTAIPERSFAAARCALRHRRPAFGTGDVHADRDARSSRRRWWKKTPLAPRYFALFCRWVHCGIFGFSSTMIVLGLRHKRTSQ